MRVTNRRQVTLPRRILDAAGIRPGDNVELRATGLGAITIVKMDADDDYMARLFSLAKRKLIKGISTDELLRMTRGDPALDPPLPPKNE